MAITLRPEVQAFAELMELKLRKNDHKGGWDGDDAHGLFVRVEEELAEFSDVLDRYPYRWDEDARFALGYEAADVANMLMMVADVVGALKTRADQYPGAKPFTDKVHADSPSVTTLPGSTEYVVEAQKLVQEKLKPFAANVETVGSGVVASPKPSVGRIVHYQAYGTPGGEHPSVPRAAIVAEVHSDEEATVMVVNPSGIFFNRVKFSETPKPGCWSWPPRV